MADELDPILEARLRGVLREDANSVPFTLRADTVRRVGAERRRARNMQRLTILAAAAVIVVAVAGISINFAMHPNSNVASSPSSSAAPSASAAPTVDSTGLASFAQLGDALRAEGVGTPALTAESTAAGANERDVVGQVPASITVLVAVSCAGGDGVTVAVESNGSQIAKHDATCGAQPSVLVLEGTMTGPGGAGTVVVLPKPSTRWRVVAGVQEGGLITASPTTSSAPQASGPNGLPGPADILGSAHPGAVQVATSIQAGSGEPITTQIGGLAHRTNIALLIECAGGPVTAYASDGSAQGPMIGTAQCDSSIEEIPFTNALDYPNLQAFQLQAPAGTIWSAIVVDYTRIPQDPAASPLPSSEIPSEADIVAVAGAIGDELGMSDGLGKPTDKTITYFGDLGSHTEIAVLIACQGSPATLTAISTAAPTAGTPIGQPICDGTVQTFVWSRTQGPADADSLRLDTGANTPWRAVVFSTAKTVYKSHPNPTVPCGKPDLTTKAPPAATLYQNGKALGEIQYYTTSWGKTSSDGVPITPATAVDATAGRLEIRIADDVCAVTWIATYTKPLPDNTPIRGSIGTLVDQGIEEGATFDTTRNRENRIDLAGLASGDWVIVVDLKFKDGDGAGVIRIHVP